ncbi:putative Zn(II)2Cys6 transcription factor [Patellaria atrata CBS 101060]|uniref:Zn(II)2Cys6 transcription factor n=1 Tax=Patellaria atrata CBS 101060 TaxID=1346257 RepID=A0A9P4SI25_9PEZI|nr:putative Zn(II)2Cys6 transcription factor [Patellaria atrata CBS 101060]
MDPHSLRASSNKTTRSKRAACLSCRRSKIRCIRGSDDSICEKCHQSNTECVVPEDYHVGRQKGIKNKRTGLDKALHQIEQALKKSKATGSPLANPSGRSIPELENLLSEAQSQLSPTTPNKATTEQNGAPGSTASTQHINQDDNLALDDAENPLQLLARASEARLPQSSRQKAHLSVSPQSYSSTNGHSTSESDEANVSWFFVPVRAHLDVGRDLDPIDLGLATLEEAETLFRYFYQKLSHTRWGLDPTIHTLDFVRSQSAFLFTSILAGSALFIPSEAALSKRLSNHRDLLAQRVILGRNRSVEIVLAFMLNVPWMSPGERSSDDETCSYMAMALKVAIDLSLNKTVVPVLPMDYCYSTRLSKSDCIDSRKALVMDGFNNVDPDSVWGRRLLRRRERAWISLFVLERGVCLARGRSFTVPVNPLIKNCEMWHVSDIRDTQDGSIASMAVLRRDLDSLFRSVRSSCDNYKDTDIGSEIARSIKRTIEAFYDRWYAKWAFAIGEGERRTLPPYVEILVIHTRLSTYSGVINHPTAPVEVKHFFRAAGLSASLNVMRAAIQGETRLKSMPNNTAIMISFAACFALGLSGAMSGNNSNLAPSVRNLIEEVADVLERIGATPSHRNGASVLYGRYLRGLVRRVPERSITAPEMNFNRMATVDSHHEMHGAGLYPPGANTIRARTTTPGLDDAGNLCWQFSAMSNNQIDDAIDQADTAWDTAITAVSWDNITGLDWFDWGNGDFGF